MSARPAVLRWLGFLRLVHGAPAPRPLHRPDEAQARRREAAHDALLSLSLQQGAAARPKG